MSLCQIVRDKYIVIRKNIELYNLHIYLETYNVFITKLSVSF